MPVSLSPEIAALIREYANRRRIARERVRLWYVAATRARDLLVLPRHSAKLSDNSWARLVDFGLEHLEALDTGIWEGRRAAAEKSQQNSQTREVFATEAVAIYKLRRTLVWQRPSRDEADWVPPPSPREFFESPEDAEECADVPVPAVAGSTTRRINSPQADRGIFDC